nr:immunoglobulin heavy chain junction region [Macaca mulatta]
CSQVTHREHLFW